MSLEPQDMKAAFKEAIKEWMDEQAAKLGWRVLHWVTISAVFAVAYFILVMNGWRKIGG